MEELFLCADWIMINYNNSHIGGSLGLFLHGYSLDRAISDLDICVPEEIRELPVSVEQSHSCPDDFDQVLKWRDIVIDVRINKEMGYTEAIYYNKIYRISLLSDILSYKEKYAARGNTKHIRDLEIIKNGLKPKNYNIFN